MNMLVLRFSSGLAIDMCHPISGLRESVEAYIKAA